LFTLEERTTTNVPDTPISRACDKAIGGLLKPDAKERIIWDPIWPEAIMRTGDYAFGDREMVTNKELLNKFEVLK
jgi:hypothetical protein